MYIYPSFFAFLFYKIEKILGVLKCRYYEAKAFQKFMNGVCSTLTCNWDSFEVHKVKFLGDNMFQRVQRYKKYFK